MKTRRNLYVYRSVLSAAAVLFALCSSITQAKAEAYERRQVQLSGLTLTVAGYPVDPVSLNPLNDLSFYAAERPGGPVERYIGKFILRDRGVLNGRLSRYAYTDEGAEVVVMEAAVGAGSEYVVDAQTLMESCRRHKAIRVLLFEMRVGQGDAGWLLQHYRLSVNGKDYRFFLTDNYDLNDKSQNNPGIEAVYAVIDDLRPGMNYVMVNPLSRQQEEQASFTGPLGENKAYIICKWFVS